MSLWLKADEGSETTEDFREAGDLAYRSPFSAERSKAVHVSDIHLRGWDTVL